jgi:hypothetical protein
VCLEEICGSPSLSPTTRPRPDVNAQANEEASENLAASANGPGATLRAKPDHIRRTQLPELCFASDWHVPLN